MPMLEGERVRGVIENPSSIRKVAVCDYCASTYIAATEVRGEACGDRVALYMAPEQVELHVAVYNAEFGDIAPLKFEEGRLLNSDGDVLDVVEIVPALDNAVMMDMIDKGYWVVEDADKQLESANWSLPMALRQQHGLPNVHLESAAENLERWTKVLAEQVPDGNLEAWQHTILTNAKNQAKMEAERIANGEL